MKNYYVAHPEYCDAVYGNQEPVCVDAREVRRLACEWGMDASELFNQLHEATTDEIDKYTNIQ